MAQCFAVEWKMSIHEVLKPSITDEVESGAEALTMFLADVFSAAEHWHFLVSAPPTNPSGGSAGCFFDPRDLALVEFESTAETLLWPTQ